MYLMENISKKTIRKTCLGITILLIILKLYLILYLRKIRIKIEFTIKNFIPQQT